MPSVLSVNHPLRNSSSSRCSPSSSSAKATYERPRSEYFESPTTLSSPIPLSPKHNRHQSFSPLGGTSNAFHERARHRAHSNRSSNQSFSTFAPGFIKSAALQRPRDEVKGIEGENDFSDKRYVWLRDPNKAFVKGWIVDEIDLNHLLIQCDDGSQRQVDASSVESVNPTKFDKANDMAELTYLNEASVIHNLQVRYQSDLIYTYSGLFLVTVNPYRSLPIYSDEYVRMYRSTNREDSRPHIYAMADCAFQNLVSEGENQSILVTGESGAGKTENTKKVIQYLAAVAASDVASKRRGRGSPDLSEQILRANPILESFGNAQTVRNNNSSRFGKFIRIEFTRSGRIAGAHIDWYLLEKSRVSRIGLKERNYHIFYQLLRGIDKQHRKDLQLDGLDVDDFLYTKGGNGFISGVSDEEEWYALLDALRIMGFSPNEQRELFRVVASVLLLGNITVSKESLRADQAAFPDNAKAWMTKACQLLGIDVNSFAKAMLHPKVKAGREWVDKVQTPDQVRSSLDALAKGIYERTFGDLVSQINRQLERHGSGLEESYFIGVLDIAGFEIFEENSFEQLCINYTNEKLQQFFNHRMFVIEQEEYAREQIEWNFIDFGKDLQPTIELIELSNPIGIFSCLDEDSVMPKATDKTFTEKLHSLWDRKTPKYHASRLSQGFVLTHYAAEVEYSTEGWLEKNKDPLNDNVTRLLAASENAHVADLFQDCVEDDDETHFGKQRIKRGLFRTVAQRHKEQLTNLMDQLHSTHPHFVRCILPNHHKQPQSFQAPLVLDQLRCNGVLEGIRIVRTGFPNRLPFSEFRQRYEVICKSLSTKHVDNQRFVQLMLEHLDLDSEIYRVGLTKVFFRAGVLADLEEKRDSLIKSLVCKFQSVARGFSQRRIASKRLYRAEATRVIRRNLAVYSCLHSNPWWKLFVRIRPFLAATQTAAQVKKRDEAIQKLESDVREADKQRSRIEDERRRNEAELHRTQQILESERLLALDKEEIFTRLQQREVELSEKLADAVDDQEKLEDQLDDLVDAKRKAESQSEKWRKELAQAGQIISRLESENAGSEDEVAELRNRILELENAETTRNRRQDDAKRENQMLQDEIQLQRSKVADLERRLHRSDQDLEIKLAKVSKDLASSKEENSRLQRDTNAMNVKLRDLSSTSEAHKNLVDRQEKELSRLRDNQRDVDSLRNTLEAERKAAGSEQEKSQNRIREIQSETESFKAQRVRLEREVGDIKCRLDLTLAERLEADKSCQAHQTQIKDLQNDLSHVQEDLDKERQSRDDISALSEHQIGALQEDYRKLNESKITIEKELYIQQDKLRRAVEARNAAEETRKDLQTELVKLRERYANLESSRIEALATAERQANEKQASLVRELDAKSRSIEEVSADSSRLTEELESLKECLADSDLFRSQHDEHKERLEREIVTVKGMLTASENDNRALLNKIQQKDLDIASTHSRAGDSQRSRIAQLQAERAALEKENRSLHTAFNDAQLSIATLEKQKDNLTLDLEDLMREIDERHTQSQSERRERSVKQLADDITQGRDKVEHLLTTLLTTIDELQAEESRSQLAARRAERDLREERENAMRLERELQGWKGLRVERGSGVRGSGGDWSRSAREHRRTDSIDASDGLSRMMSTTKGFL